MIYTLLGLLAYFLPTSVAMLRNRKSTKWIIAINLLTGWTGFGWLGALIWAFIGKPNPNPKPRSAKQTMRLRVAAIACALATIGLVIVPQLDPSVSEGIVFSKPLPVS